MSNLDNKWVLDQEPRKGRSTTIKYAIGRYIIINRKKRWVYRIRQMTIHRLHFDDDMFFRRVSNTQQKRYPGWQLEGYAEVSNPHLPGFENQLRSRAGK